MANERVRVVLGDAVTVEPRVRDAIIEVLRGDDEPRRIRCGPVASEAERGALVRAELREMFLRGVLDAEQTAAALHGYAKDHPSDNHPPAPRRDEPTVRIGRPRRQPSRLAPKRPAKFTKAPRRSRGK